VQNDGHVSKEGDGLDIYPPPSGEQQAIPPPLAPTDGSRAKLPPPTESDTPMEDILNSFTSIPADVILDSHVVYMQEVKKWYVANSQIFLHSSLTGVLVFSGGRPNEHTDTNVIRRGWRCEVSTIPTHWIQQSQIRRHSKKIATLHITKQENRLKVRVDPAVDLAVGPHHSGGGC
jgi:hypothetical protein